MAALADVDAWRTVAEALRPTRQPVVVAAVDEDVIGRPVEEVLGLDWIDRGNGGAEGDTNGDGVSDPIETSLEWGVRSLGKRVSVNAEGDLPAQAVADVFPAYDDDGGLLLVLTPEG